MRSLIRLAVAAALAATLALGAPPSRALAAAQAARPAAPSTPVGQQSGPPGMRLLVRFAVDSTAQGRARALASVGGAVDAVLEPLGIARVVLPGGADDAFGDGEQVAAFLARDPAIAFAELDRTVHLGFDPNDTYYLNDPFVGLGQWGIRKAQVNAAWDRVRGSAAVTVAVIDTGVDPNHPDLAGAIVPGTTFLSAPTPGCAVQANDDNSHGTHVAGIIAANGNNGAGVAGVAFGVRVMPIKAMDCSGTGSVSDIAQAIVYATDHGARIVNVSLGATADSAALHGAVQYALQHNTLVVTAAGNCGCSTESSYPAAYAEALAVAATDVDDTRASFSTIAPYVGVAAPGRRIVSTTPSYDTYLSRNNGLTKSYGALSGTSQATPFAAGVAALVLSQDPTLSAAQVAARLRATADDLGAPGVDTSFGAGRVNALRAVTATAPAPTASPAPTPAAAAPPPPAAPAIVYGATYDTSVVPRAAVAGGQLAATVKLTNASSFAWSASGESAVHLVSQWTDAAGVTLGGATLATLSADVAVGASAAVPLLVPVPTAGTRTLRLDLLQGALAFSTRGVAPAAVAVIVGAPANGASYVIPGTGAAPSLAVATPATLSVTISNTGNLTWSAAGANPVHVSYHWIGATGNVLVWDGLRTNLPSDVIPGQSITLPLAVLPPAAVGTYTLRVDLVQEGVAWFSGRGVAARDVVVSVTTGYAASYRTSAAALAVLPGIRITLPVTVRNDGVATWASSGANPVHLSTHVSDAAGNTVQWDGERVGLAVDVAPGSSAALALPVSSLLTPGTYRVRIDLVREGVAWFSSLGVQTLDVSLAVSADFRATLSTGPLTVSRGQHTAAVMVTNTSGVLWSSGGTISVGLAAHWLDAAGTTLVWDGPRTRLAQPVSPGDTLTLTVDLGPVPPSAAFVTIDLVADGLRWFGAGTIRPVTLVP